MTGGGIDALGLQRDGEKQYYHYEQQFCAKHFASPKAYELTMSDQPLRTDVV